MITKEMFGEHKQECFDRIVEIQKIHDEWWSHLKQVRAAEQGERIRANLEKNHETAPQSFGGP